MEIFALMSRTTLRPRWWWAIATLALVGAIAPLSNVAAQTATPRQPLRLESDIQEANAQTGVVTARGNVRINYPARRIQATAVQAQYFSRERRIVLSGNVYVLQDGNSLRGERILYLIDEGRFIALPEQGRQVEAIYLVPDANTPITGPGPSPVPQASPPALPPIPTEVPSAPMPQLSPQR